MSERSFPFHRYFGAIFAGGLLLLACGAPATRHDSPDFSRGLPDQEDFPRMEPLNRKDGPVAILMEGSFVSMEIGTKLVRPEDMRETGWLLMIEVESRSPEPIEEVEIALEECNASRQCSESTRSLGVVRLGGRGARGRITIRTTRKRGDMSGFRASVSKVRYADGTMWIPTTIIDDTPGKP